MLQFCQEFEQIQVKEFDVNEIYDNTIKEKENLDTAIKRSKAFAQHLLFTTEEQFKAIANKSKYCETITEQNRVVIRPKDPEKDNLAGFKLTYTGNNGIRINIRNGSINFSAEHYLKTKQEIETFEAKTMNHLIDMIIDTAKRIANYDWTLEHPSG